MGNKELVRICSSEKHSRNSEMICAFSMEIRKSKRLKIYTNVPIDEIKHIDEALNHISTVAHFDTNDKCLVENITLCLDALRLVQIVYNRLNYLRSQSFNLSSHGDHVLLLDILWINLMVAYSKDLPTDANPVKDSDRDWKLLGFQSNDPSTDFRGMGILGLHQLVYFSTKRSSTAFMILSESKNRNRYFPFAVTGINITQFLLQLLTETRLHQLFFEKYEQIVFSVNVHHSLSGPIVENAQCTSRTDFNRASYDDVCVDKACDIFHDAYCDIYEEFFMLWMTRNPTDIMNFSLIFDELKDIIRNKYAPL